VRGQLSSSDWCFPGAFNRLWQGRLAQLSGRGEWAQAAWRAGLASAERLGLPFEAALAHAELGRHAAGTPQGHRHLEQAQTLMRELELPSSQPTAHKGRSDVLG
jgi:hypothetical protein